MKVLIVRNAFSYDFGGAERLAVHLAKELQLNNINVIVMSRQAKLLEYAKSMDVPRIKGWWWSRQNWSGVLAILFPVYLLWQLVLFVWYLITISRLKPDAVHLMSKDDFVAGTFAAKLLAKRVVWTDTADLKHIFANHNKWYKNPSGKLVYYASKHANFIGFVSHSEQKLVEASLGHKSPAQFQVMHIAGKDEPVVPIERSETDRDAVIFCATSRLVYAKGIDELIQAFKLLTENSDAYRLWLVGDGPDEKAFRKAAEGNAFITFLGHSATPLRYVAASDVFVHPTHHEGFSLSLSEAAMLGKPLLATDVGGNPELVNDSNGLLVPAKNPQKLCEAMETLGSDHALRERLGKNARNDYKNKFDFSLIIKEKLVPLYNQPNSKGLR